MGPLPSDNEANHRWSSVPFLRTEPTMSLSERPPCPRAQIQCPTQSGSGRLAGHPRLATLSRLRTDPPRSPPAWDRPLRPSRASTRPSRCELDPATRCRTCRATSSVIEGRTCGRRRLQDPGRRQPPQNLATAPPNRHGVSGGAPPIDAGSAWHILAHLTPTATFRERAIVLRSEASGILGTSGGRLGLERSADDGPDGGCSLVPAVVGGAQVALGHDRRRVPELARRGREVDALVDQLGGGKGPELMERHRDRRLQALAELGHVLGYCLGPHRRGPAVAAE